MVLESALVVTPVTVALFAGFVAIIVNRLCDMNPMPFAFCAPRNKDRRCDVNMTVEDEEVDKEEDEDRDEHIDDV